MVSKWYMLVCMFSDGDLDQSDDSDIRSLNPPTPLTPHTPSTPASNDDPTDRSAFRQVVIKHIKSNIELNCTLHFEKF